MDLSGEKLITHEYLPDDSSMCSSDTNSDCSSESFTASCSPNSTITSIFFCPGEDTTSVSRVIDEEVSGGPIVWYFYRELIERGSHYVDMASRCLPFLRPQDFVVCPRANPLMLDQLAALQAQQPLFSSQQIIWIDHPCLEDSYECHGMFLRALNENPLLKSCKNIVIGPYVVTPKVLRCATDPVSVGGQQVADLQHRLTVFGDGVHSTVTKSWLHSFPREGHTPQKTKAGVRVPRGYLCYDAEDLYLAFRLLRHHGVDRMMFKPSFSQAGMGIVEVHSTQDIGNLPLSQLLGCLGSSATRAEYGYDRHLEGAPFILEEQICVAEGLPSPVLQSLGSQTFPCCDQVLEGHVHMGNAYPSKLPPFITSRCERAFKALREHESFSLLNGFWGVDFVIEADSHEPVLVDLNMARPNGNHFNLIFVSLLPVPPAAWTTRKVYYPECAPIEVVDSFKERGIFLDTNAGCGAWLLSFVSGQKGRVFVGGASQAEVDQLVEKVDACMADLKTQQHKKGK